MTEQDILYQAIRDNPWDDAPRLAYADCMLENNLWSEEQVDLCRLQCGQELGRWKRIGVLLRTLAIKAWYQEITERYFGGMVNVQFQTMTIGRCIVRSGHPETIVINRGFIETWETYLNGFYRLGKVIGRQHPFTKVDLKDRRPFTIWTFPPESGEAVPIGGYSWSWQLKRRCHWDSHYLPRSWRQHWYRLTRTDKNGKFQTSKEAIDMLNTFCCGWAGSYNIAKYVWGEWDSETQQFTKPEKVYE